MKTTTNKFKKGYADRVKVYSLLSIVAGALVGIITANPFILFITLGAVLIHLTANK